jgi:hypothetical protein
MLATLASAPVAVITNTIIGDASKKSAATEAGNFFSSGIGAVLQSVLIVVGLAVIIFSLFKVVMKALQGNTTGAVKSLAMGLFLAALFFSPVFIGSIIDVVVNVWSSVVGTAESVTSSR